MSLDAWVYCNCFEAGALRESPPHPEYMRVAQNGGLLWENPAWTQVKQNWQHSAWQIAMQTDIEFYDWRRKRACEHPDGILVHQRIGSRVLVNALQTELSREAEKFPIILGRILHSNSHCGDCLPLPLVCGLEPELCSLADFVWGAAQTDCELYDFYQKLTQLVHAALSVNKPICF